MLLPIIEVNDPAAFLTLAKDLKPLGRVIIFEKQGRYRFMTRQGDDVMSVSYTPTGPYPVSNPQGQVTYDIPVRPPYDSPLGWTDIYRKLGITTRIRLRDEALSGAIKHVLASSRPSRMRWTSSDPQIKGTVITVQNIGVTLTITLQYSDIHVRELTRLLTSTGFKVITGAITHS